LLEDGEITPSDTHFAAQWHLNNTGQSGGVSGADIEALECWQILDQSPGVIVAVLDTGADFTHPEFDGVWLPGYDCVEEDEDASATNPHGIYVAGLIGAVRNNSFGGTGVTQHSKLLPVRVLAGPLGTAFNLAQGIDYAVSQGADVINMSLVNYPDSSLLKGALALATAANTILIGSAGNSGPGTADASWPGASPLVMSIGATNASDQRADFSASGNVVDFVAPGKAVLTTAASHDNTMEKFTGTSAAAPIATGIASLLRAYNPYLTQAQIYALFQAGAADQVGLPAEDTPGWDPYYGHGRLNAFRSIQALCSCDADDPFTASPPKLTWGVEESLVFRLSAGSANALQPYLILGSLSGSQPASQIGQTAWPLSLDAYMRLCLFGPSPVVGSAGFLNGDGEALAWLTVPAAARTSLGGITFHHAAAVFDGGLERPLAAPPLFLSAPVESGVHGLPERLYHEDFESGAVGWIFDNGVNGQWHIAPPGECGSASHRAAYNSGAPACEVGGGTAGTLRSPAFVLSGLAPYRIRFSTVVDLPAELGTVLVELVDETGIATLKAQQWKASQFGDVVDGEATYELSVQESPHYDGRTVHLEARCTALVSAVGQGWWLDDLEVWNSGSE